MSEIYTVDATTTLNIDVLLAESLVTVHAYGHEACCSPSDTQLIAKSNTLCLYNFRTATTECTTPPS